MPQAGIPELAEGLETVRRASIVIVTVVTSLLLTGGILQRHALACDLLPLLHYQQLNSDVFLAADLSEPQARIINELIDSASERIGTVYGKPISKPRFIITADIHSAANWGANETASMHRMPWRACIVIGPKGRNVDVIAHEWLHAEIQHRVGFFRFLREIPVWFDEGAALTLDYREPFLPASIQLTDADVAAVKYLKSGRSFFSNNIRQNYQASRLAVAPLILSEQFFNDLEQIASGEAFENVFLNRDVRLK
jgi:hypothetical protein